jgi:hypothetical protein
MGGVVVLGPGIGIRGEKGGGGEMLIEPGCCYRIVECFVCDGFGNIRN